MGGRLVGATSVARSRSNGARSFIQAPRATEVAPTAQKQKGPGFRADLLACAGWWREKDSNLRRQCRQIYSLIPLTARESLHGTQGADYIRVGELVKHLRHPAQTPRRVAQSPRKPAQASRRVAQSSRSPAQSLRRPARFSSQPEQFSSQPEKFSRQPAQTPRGMAQSPGRTSHGLEDLAQGSGEISRTSRRVSRASRRASCGLREMDEELRGLAGKSRGCTESSGKSEGENKTQKKHILKPINGSQPLSVTSRAARAHAFVPSPTLA